MRLVGLADNHGHYRYEGPLELDRAGRYGFTVRVVPHHTDLTAWSELGRVAWA